VFEEHVEGMAALEKVLDQLPEKLQRNVIRGGLRAGGKVFVSEARRRASVKTGELRNSIRISSIRKTRTGGLLALIKAGNKKAWYPHLVEFGTRAHMVKPVNAKALAIAGQAVEKVRHPGAGAHPFMRPAFDIGARGAITAYAAYIRRRLTKAGIETLTED